MQLFMYHDADTVSIEHFLPAGAGVEAALSSLTETDGRAPRTIRPVRPAGATAATRWPLDQNDRTPARLEKLRQYFGLTGQNGCGAVIHRGRVVSQFGTLDRLGIGFSSCGPTIGTRRRERTAQNGGAENSICI